MNKTGIYFAYWEREWNADYCSYINRVKKLGFDCLSLMLHYRGDESTGLFF